MVSLDDAVVARLEKGGKRYEILVHPELVEQFKSDLIVLMGNLYGEVPSKILNLGNQQAEEALVWWQKKFGKDLYIELMRHNQEDEERVNKVLLTFAEKYNIKIVATNNSY